MQPTPLFFPLAYDTNNRSLPVQLLRMEHYKGPNVLHKMYTVPFVIQQQCLDCSQNTPSLNQVQIWTSAGVVYYSVEELAQFENYYVMVVDFYTENENDEFEFNNLVFLPTIENELLKQRYNNCTVIDPEETVELTKPTFEELSVTPYLWNRHTRVVQDLDYDEDNDYIILNNVTYERSFEFPTLHEIRSKNHYFKPTLHEVLSQLPLTSNEPFLVMTEMLSNDIDVMVQGDYHIGITTVFTPVINHDTKRPRTE